MEIYVKKNREEFPLLSANKEEDPYFKIKKIIIETYNYQ